jgi:class 3 adenylate cyclase
VIGKKLEILEDKTNLLTIEDIRGMDDGSRWTKSESDKPSFGYSYSSYWVKFQVENKKDKPVKYFLELDYAILDYAHFYFEEDGLTKEIVLGDMIPFNKRSIANRNPIFEINVQGNQKYIYYMKFASEGSIIVPLILWKPFHFYKNDHQSQILYGLYFGIVAVMMLYNLFLYFSIRDAAYLYYVIYLIGGSGALLSFAGLSLEYLFPDFPKLVNTLLLVSFGLLSGGALLFSISFLNTKKILPLADYFLKFMLLPCILIIIGAFYFNYRTIVMFSNLTVIFSSILMLLTGIVSFLKGFRAARLYLLGWTFVLTGIVLFAIRNIGLIPINFITSHAGEIGSIFEIILLSLALADRINILKKEKEESQKALIEEQEESIATQKELITSYARFVPEQLLTFLGKDIITKVGLGDSVQKDMTILFSDIRSFTSISEGLSPSENFGFINSYLETMGPIIRKHNGFIDKYIGDAIMALFPQKPSDAIDASIEMLEALYILNVKRKTKGFVPISIGIGIHTGSQMLGIIGEKERMEGTVISDVVNTASRLEGLTKAYSTALLISEDVLEGVEDKSKYEYRFLDTVKVKGKNKAVRILEILNGVSPRIRELKMETRPDFEAGIDFYYNKKFKDSLKKMKSVLKKDSKDKAAELYIERCNFYTNNGVDMNWDGIEKLDFK